MEWKFPDVGEGLHEAQVVAWHVHEGDHVERDAPLLDVETDKSVVTIPSPVAGTVEKVLFREGDTVHVGEVVVVFGGADGVASDDGGRSSGAPAPAAEVSPTVDATASPSAEPSPVVLATPAVRRLARELGVALTEVRGTGERGRVLAEDVRRAAEQRSEPAGGHQPEQVQGAPGQPARARAETVAPVESASETPAVELQPADQRRPLVGVRRRIADNMARAWAHAVHVTVVEELVVDELVALRERINAYLAPQRMSYLPLVVKAVASVLARFPEFNASLDEEAREIVVHAQRHIGIAVDDPEGLLVPVVRDADRRSVRELVTELGRLIEGARQHTLGPADLTGSTFTITNFGSIGGIVATPIINYPNVAILGMGPIRRRAVVRADDRVEPASVMFLSLTFDHRVVDGGAASRFLVALKAMLENPAALLTELV